MLCVITVRMITDHNEDNYICFWYDVKIMRINDKGMVHRGREKSFIYQLMHKRVSLKEY
jgi:hypothetical protein